MLCYVISYYTIYYTILHYTILAYVIVQYRVLYHAICYCSSGAPKASPRRLSEGCSSRQRPGRLGLRGRRGRSLFARALGSACQVWYIYIYICICVCVYIYMYMYICVYIYTYIYIYIYTHTYTHTYIHTHTYANQRLRGSFIKNLSPREAFGGRPARESRAALGYDFSRRRVRFFTRI